MSVYLTTHPRDVVAYVETITPDIARAYLERNAHNRRIRLGHVRLLASDMKNGRWDMNGESVKFDSEGNLIDGQHRLSAIVAADTAIRLMVIRGLAPETQATIDIGKGRTVAQQLQLAGVNNTNALAAIALMMWRYKNYPNRIWSAKIVMSKAEQYDAVRHSEETLRYHLGIGAEAKRKAGIRTTPYAVASMIVAQSGSVDERAARLRVWDQFHHGVITGENLQSGDPRLTLRNRTINFHSTQHHLWDQQVWLAYVLKAYNAHAEGRTLSPLKFSPNELPMPNVASV